MTSTQPGPADPDSSIRSIYHGTLADFIARRDAHAKELKGRGEKDEAARVKALKKPSKLAWALDQAALDEPNVVTELVAAIERAQAAHADPAAARTAQEKIRTAVRAVADAGARAAIRSRAPIDASDLVQAVRAVIGDSEAFTALVSGTLVDVPEGGGLDLLTGMTLPVGAATGAASSRGTYPSAAGIPDVIEATDAASRGRDLQAERAKREADAAAERTRREASAADARRELIRAETSLSSARGRAQAAERTVLGAQARLEAAEEQLERAREQAEARRGELERAEAEAAAAQKTLEQLERRVEDLRAASEASL
jgi:hypothetical protein